MCGAGGDAVRGTGQGRRWRRWLATFAAIVIGLTAGVAPSSLGPERAEAAWLDPISCGRLYAVGQQGNSWHVFAVDHDSGALTVNNTVALPSRQSLNGLAVDQPGGAFWMVGQRTGQTSASIVRVDATTGEQTDFDHPLPGAPNGNGGLVMGAVNPDNGIYYFGLISPANDLHIWGFDTETKTAVPGVIGRVPLGRGQGGDFAFDSRGRLYVVSRGIVLVLDDALPATGSPSPGPELAGTVIANPPANAIGSMAFGPDGYVYVAGQRMYRLNPSSGEVAGSSELTPAATSIGDMASCATPNVITLVKDLPDGRHRPDDQFRLAITGGGLTEGHEGVTSGDQPGVQDRTPAAVAGPALGLAGTTYTITETAAGTTDLDHYRSSWSCVDRRSGEVFAEGTGSSGTFALPAGTARGAEIGCTFSNRLRDRGDGEAEVSKSVDPVSGSVVTPGQVVGYRLTFSNTGEASAPVDLDEVITGVLDDATLSSVPRSSDSALTVSAVADGRFTVAGRLGPGKTVIISYAVRIKPDGRRGDDVLRDAAVPAGAAPSAACDPDDLLCTEHPVPAIEAKRSADPKPGTEVEAGRVLTYRLTFTNTGAAPAAIEFDDVIADVLDDATLVRKPISSDPDVAVSAVTGGRMIMSGTVKPGRTATVTYAVKIKPDGSRGDGRLAGFLIKTGGEPPSECVAGNARCTVHRVGGSS